jgi:very-short-patch-repair endonuclease
LAIDDARRRRLTDWDRLLDALVLHARRGRDGVGTLRSILDDHFGERARTDSGFERLVLALLKQSGLPEPVLQHTVRVDGRDYRLDLAYPRSRLAIELDGGIHRRREVWENDHLRQNALILAGWTVLRFTWREYKDHPGRLVAAIRAALPPETW